MHLEEFRKMVYKMKLTDIQDDEELKTATLFLTDVGSLLHYNDRRHNLHELYFVDPRWLCDMMVTIVTVKERNSFVKRGVETPTPSVQGRPVPSAILQPISDTVGSI